MADSSSSEESIKIRLNFLLLGPSPSLFDRLATKSRFESLATVPLGPPETPGWSSVAATLKAPFKAVRQFALIRASSKSYEQEGTGDVVGGVGGSIGDIGLAIGLLPLCEEAASCSAGGVGESGNIMVSEELVDAGEFGGLLRGTSVEYG